MDKIGAKLYFSPSRSSGVLNYCFSAYCWSIGYGAAGPLSDMQLRINLLSIIMAMNVYPYTQMATRVALSFCMIWQERLVPFLFAAAATPVCLLIAKYLLSAGLLLGYKTRIMAAVAAFLLLLDICSVLYISRSNDLQLSLPIIFFTGAVVLFRDRHYYWSIDALLEQGMGGE